ncbi:DUF7210 family protein [Clostridium tyrobutyricum]|uniref:DUF7210 family protein n=1 Tax=Clostridium tyrobutyricum TaxID=1519 RepID=UPI0011CAF2F2|nr:hypothetical protein [Clostridium tyrobutyricum]MBV4427177.1 hypothetical protein [Clostridium tyrobutyricum]MBV4442488.1 hypothetical protein [Clostridium tyrobutyricum]
MSIKVLSNVKHNGSNYKSGDIIKDITKDEAFRLINLSIAELVDDKFKQPREKINQRIVFKNRQRHIRENEYI